LGLGKKVLIANHMGLVADEIFGKNYLELDTISAWVGSLAYTFQIYFDFSGYSDMAIGLAKMMGFKFPENFNNPYISQSITEFWRRWHITLGSWMKNYLYIPLGGNKVSTKRLYFNLWLVFLTSGLWHGASWSFVFWGAFHGFFLVIERAFLLKVFTQIGKIPSILITFLIVNIGWVFFRVEKINDAFLFITRLFIFDFNAAPIFDIEFKTYLVVAVFFSFFAVFKFNQKIQDSVYFDAYSDKKHLILASVSLLIFVISVSSITSFGFNPFIYFRF
jgi:alginate O-acetyltransferase complex protein AlgI